MCRCHVVQAKKLRMPENVGNVVRWQTKLQTMNLQRYP